MNTSQILPTHLRIVCLLLHVPAQDSSEQRGIEALRRGQTSLNLSDRHLVLGGGAEEGQAARDGAEDLCRVGHAAQTQAFFSEGQGRDRRSVELRWDRHCRQKQKEV